MVEAKTESIPIVVKALIVTEQFMGKQKRKHKAVVTIRNPRYYPVLTGLPGGQVEESDIGAAVNSLENREPPEDTVIYNALVREIKEETGLVVSADKRYWHLVYWEWRAGHLYIVLGTFVRNVIESGLQPFGETGEETQVISISRLRQLIAEKQVVGRQAKILRARKTRNAIHRIVSRGRRGVPLRD